MTLEDIRVEEFEEKSKNSSTNSISLENEEDEDDKSINFLLRLFSAEPKKRSKKSQEIFNIRNQKYLEYNALYSSLSSSSISVYYIEMIKKIKQTLHFELYPNLMYKKGQNLNTVAAISAASTLIINESPDSSSTHIPILVENIPSSSSILSALHTIFKAYIKGNALTGQMKPMNRVSIGEKELNLSDFLLQGPFLSLKGFLRFIFDFKISFLPINKATKSNFMKNFSELINEENSNPEESNSSLLHLEEVLILFQESSSSLLPLLVTKKNLTVYREKVNNYQKILSSQSNSTNSVSPSNLEGWNSVFHWADSIDNNPNHILINNEWNSSSGLNFMQFVDCVSVS